MAYPQYQDSIGSIESSYTTTHTISTPTTKTADDIWILVWAADGGAGTVTGPSGWTEVLAEDLSANQVARIWIYRATGSEGSSVTVTTSNGNRSAALIRRYSGVSTDTLDDVWSVSTSATGYSTAPDPASATASWGTGDNLAVALAAHIGGLSYGTFTAYPSGYSDGAASEEPNQVGVAGADLEVSSASEDPGSFTLSAVSVWFAATVVLQPVPDGITVTVNDSGTVGETLSAELPLAPRPADSGSASDGVGTTVALANPPQEFPVGRLPVKVELYITEGLGGTGWIDVSDRVLAQTLDLARGRADESSLTEPASLTIELDNADGAFTPGNGNSIYYPGVDQGMKVRLSIEAGSPALVLDSSAASYAACADDPDFATTDVDIRVRLEPDGWSQGLSWTADGLPAWTNFQRLVTKWIAATNDRQWNFFYWGDAFPSVEWSTNGTAAGGTWLTSYRSQAAVRPTWLAMTLDTNNGSGSYVASIWRSDDVVPPTDVTEWALVEQFTGTATSVYHSAADILVGALTPTGNLSQVFVGRILEVQIRSAINGPLVANPKFTEVGPGTTSFVDGVGKTWTLSGKAEISGWRTRFVGTADEIVPFWPHGDNQPIYEPEDLAPHTITLWSSSVDSPPSEHRVSITANGILRRLGQGADPLESTLRRHLTSIRETGIDAYWPIEDPEGAGSFSAGRTNHGPMSIVGVVKPGADDSFVSSAPLATIEADVEATVRGVVPDGNDAWWAVDWFFKLPEVDTNFVRLITIRTAGDLTEIILEVSSTAVRFRVLGSGGSTLVSNTYGAPSVDIVSDDWKLGRIEMWQSGSDVVFKWNIFRIDTGGGDFDLDVITSVTLERVSIVEVSMIGPPSGYSFGHVVVSDGTRQTGWLAGADTAWVGESAAWRFKRLCLEEGIPCDLVGGFYDYTIFRGDLEESQPMGPQGRKPLLELLGECVTIDGAIMIERRGQPGLIYRFRGGLENQTPRLTLDASLNQITNPLEPRRDDQRLRNDVEVAAEHGTATRVIDQDSVDKRGRYSTSETVAGVGGVHIQNEIVDLTTPLGDWIRRQNLDLASWILHLGTWPGLRYPTLVVPLDIVPELIDSWLELELGDRIQVINLPAQHPDEVVDLIVDRVTETMTPTIWRPELTCSPGGPWIIGELQ